MPEQVSSVTPVGILFSIGFRIFAQGAAQTAQQFSETATRITELQKQARTYIASIQNQFRFLTSTAVIAATTLGYVLRAAGASAIQFEQQYARLGAMLGAKGLGRELADQIVQVSVSYRQSVDRVMDAAEDLVSATVPFSQIPEVLRKASLIAWATGGSIKEASSALLSLMEAYGISANQVGRAAGVLYAAWRYGRGTLYDFAQGLARAGMLSKEVGVSMEELAAIISLLTLRGVNAIVMGERLNSLFIDYIKHSHEWISAAIRMGMSLDVNAIKTKGFLEFVRQVNSEMRRLGLSAGDVAKYFQTYKYTMTALIPILQEAHHIQAMMQLMSYGQVQLYESAAIAMGTFASSLEALRSQWRALIRRMGETLIPIIEITVKGMNRLTAAIGEAHRSVRVMMISITSMFTLFSGIILTMRVLGMDVFQSLANVIAGTQKFLYGLQDVFSRGGLTGAAEQIKRVLDDVTKSILEANHGVLSTSVAIRHLRNEFKLLGLALLHPIAAFKALFSTSPILAISLALSALVAVVHGLTFAISKLTNKWREQHDAVYSVSKYYKDLYETMSATVSRLVEEGTQRISEYSRIMLGAYHYLNEIKRLWVDWQRFGRHDEIFNVLVRTVRIYGELVGMSNEEVIQLVRHLYVAKDAQEVFNHAASYLVRYYKDAQQALADLIQMQLLPELMSKQMAQTAGLMIQYQAALKQMQELESLFVGGAKERWRRYTEILTAIYNKFYRVLTYATNIFMDELERSQGDVSVAISNTAEFLAETYRKIIEEARGLITGISGMISPFEVGPVEKFTDQIDRFLKYVIRFAKEGIKEVNNVVKQLAQQAGFLNVISKNLPKVPPAPKKETYDKMAQAAESVVKEQDLVNQAIGRFSEQLRKAINDAKTATDILSLLQGNTFRLATAFASVSAGIDDNSRRVELLSQLFKTLSGLVGDAAAKYELLSGGTLDASSATELFNSILSVLRDNWKYLMSLNIPGKEKAIAESYEFASKTLSDLLERMSKYNIGAKTQLELLASIYTLYVKMAESTGDWSKALSESMKGLDKFNEVIAKTIITTKDLRDIPSPIQGFGRMLAYFAPHIKESLNIVTESVRKVADSVGLSKENTESFIKVLENSINPLSVFNAILKELGIGWDDFSKSIEKFSIGFREFSRIVEEMIQRSSGISRFADTFSNLLDRFVETQSKIAEKQNYLNELQRFYNSLSAAQLESQKKIDEQWSQIVEQALSYGVHADNANELMSKIAGLIAKINSEISKLQVEASGVLDEMNLWFSMMVKLEPTAQSINEAFRLITESLISSKETFTDYSWLLSTSEELSRKLVDTYIEMLPKSRQINDQERERLQFLMQSLVLHRLLSRVEEESLRIWEEKFQGISRRIKDIEKSAEIKIALGFGLRSEETQQMIADFRRLVEARTQMLIMEATKADELRSRVEGLKSALENLRSEYNKVQREIEHVNEELKNAKANEEGNEEAIGKLIDKLGEYQTKMLTLSTLISHYSNLLRKTEEELQKFGDEYVDTQLLIADAIRKSMEESQKDLENLYKRQMDIISKQEKELDMQLKMGLISRQQYVDEMKKIIEKRIELEQNMRNVLSQIWESIISEMKANNKINEEQAEKLKEFLIELIKIMDERIAELTLKWQEVHRENVKRWEEVLEDLKAIYSKVIDSLAIDLYRKGKIIQFTILQIFDEFRSGLARTLLDVIEGKKKLSEALKEMILEIIRRRTELILEILITKFWMWILSQLGIPIPTITPTGGGGGGGGGTNKAQKGGYVKPIQYFRDIAGVPRKDLIPVVVSPGELILPAPMVDALRQALSAPRPAVVTSEVPRTSTVAATTTQPAAPAVNVTFNVHAIDSESFTRTMMKHKDVITAIINKAVRSGAV